MFFCLLSLAFAESSLVFVGNSYTQYNALPNQVGTLIADHTGWSTTTTSSLTGGGLNLADHANRMTDQGSTWQETFATAHDWFIFQDQSQIPGFPEAEVYWQNSLAGLQAMHTQVSVVGGQSMLMLTWGRRDGDLQNPAFYQTFEDMQERLNNGYLSYANQASTLENPIFVAPVGPVFATIKEIDPDLFTRLYDNDGSHPSQLGSTVASLSIVASLTGRSVASLNHGLTDEVDTLVSAIEQTILEDAVGTYPLPWIWSVIPEDGRIEHSTMKPLLRIRADQTLDLEVVDGRLWLENGRLQGTVTVAEGSGFRVDGGAQVGVVNGDLELRSGRLRLTEVTGDFVQTGGEVWVDAAEVTIGGEATLTLLELHPDLDEAYIFTAGFDATNLQVGEGLAWAEGLDNSIHLVRMPEQTDTAEPSTDPTEDTGVDKEDTGCAGGLIGLWLLLPLWARRQRH